MQNHNKKYKVASSQKATYSQRKRAALDYRREYFKRNPGILGCIWVCAYCGRPLLGREKVVVDHIMPLNNPLGANAPFNLVAACQECNSKKSDTVDGRVLKGYAAKIVQSCIFSIQKIALIAIVGIWTVALNLLGSIHGAVASAFHGISLKYKMVCILVILIIAWHCFKSWGWR